MDKREHTPGDDWFSRVYGPEMGAVAKRLRDDHDKAMRWTWKDYMHVAASWTYALVRIGAVSWFVIMIVNYLQNHC